VKRSSAIVLLVLFVIFLALTGCDSQTDEPKPRQTPTPSPVPWQRAQQPITLVTAPSIALLGRLDDHHAAVIDLKFSNDSVFLATTSPGDSQVRVWNLASGRATLTINNAKARWLFFGPENETFILIDQTLQIQEWSLSSRQQIQSLAAQNGDIGPADQSHDLLRVAIGGGQGRVYLFLLNPLRSYGYIEAHPVIPVQHVLFTPDGNWLVTIGDGGSMKLWDFGSKALIHDFGRFSQEPANATMSPDGKAVVLATTSSIQFWSLENYELQRSISVRENSAVNYIGFSPDGSVLLAYGLGNNVSLWNINTGELLIELPGHGQDVSGAAFSNDQQLLLTGSREAGLFLWDLSILNQLTGQDTQVQIPRSQIAPPRVEIYRLAWSPDQRWIVFSDIYGLVYVMGLPN
jgi:WD40 repeat protein